MRGAATAGFGRKRTSAYEGIPTASLKSLIETAMLNGLDLEAYLRHVLNVIADHQASQVADLLAWNFTGITVRLQQK